MSAKILQCSCKNSYQDGKYGPSNRVHTPRGGKYEGQFRCTVCANVRSGG